MVLVEREGGASEDSCCYAFERSRVACYDKHWREESKRAPMSSSSDCTNA
jgi:hypothetical protein